VRREFYDIYKDLSNSYQAIFGFPRLRPRYIIRRVLLGLDVAQGSLVRWGERWVREGIDSAVADLDDRSTLRPDGKHFLLTNFVEMIVLPIVHPGNPIPVDRGELRDAIVEDVRTLVRTAGERRPGEITGGDVLKVAAELWDRLRINELRFWGARANAVVE